MKEFFDTSVLVASFLGDHPHHTPSARLFAAAERKRSVCAAHTLAEVYATLTKLPLRPMIAPEQALLFLNDIRDRFSIVALEAEDYVNTLEALAGRRVTGGRVYDALLLQCAAKARADVIYTWNLRHFQQIAPELAGKIRTP